MNIGLREIQIVVALILVVEYVVHCILIRNGWRNCGRDVPLRNILNPFSLKAELNAIREDMDKRSKGIVAGGDDELDRKKINQARVLLICFCGSAAAWIIVAAVLYKHLVA